MSFNIVITDNPLILEETLQINNRIFKFKSASKPNHYYLLERINDPNKYFTANLVMGFNLNERELKYFSLFVEEMRLKYL
jgi:hypothetical protein